MKDGNSIKALICFFALAFVMGCASTGGQVNRAAMQLDAIHWYSLQEGRTKAAAESKPMVIDFATAGACPRCAKMSENVYSNPKIIKELNTEFVPVRINLGQELTPEEKALGEQYNYKNDCLLLFLDPKGNAIEQENGKKMCFADYVGPDWFLDYLKYIRKHLKEK